MNLTRLRQGNHHCRKLQEAYNRYGERRFKWSYREVRVKNLRQLNLIERKVIAKKESYKKGYNDCWMGDSDFLIFDYDTACGLAQMLREFSGITKMIANHYSCSVSLVVRLKHNPLFRDKTVPDKKIIELIRVIGIPKENLNENYVPNNVRKLEKEQIFEILSIMSKEEGYKGLLSDIYEIDEKSLYKLIRGMRYSDWAEEFY